jgi:hypothetical protein
MLEVVAILAGILLALGAVVWAGFLVPVRPFPPPEDSPVEWVPIPDDVPGPVHRYLRAVSPDGESIPEVARIEYGGTGSARPFGVWLPIRHYATIVPGASMERVMEFPWFGAKLIHAEDTYRGGAGATALSGLVNGVTEGPDTDQGAFLALAAESVLVPSWTAFGGAWDALDEHRARLTFPFRDGHESLVVAFDPDTGLPARIEADRYKSEDGPKTRWAIELREYRRSVQGLSVPGEFAVRWEDEDGPWSRWAVDRLVVSSAPR